MQGIDNKKRESDESDSLNEHGGRMIRKKAEDTDALNIVKALFLFSPSSAPGSEPFYKMGPPSVLFAFS